MGAAWQSPPFKKGAAVHLKREKGELLSELTNGNLAQILLSVGPLLFDETPSEYKTYLTRHELLNIQHKY